jgi:hypothetical protein
LAIAGEARASALAAPKIALRMDVAPFLIPFFCFFVALWKKTREPVVRFMNACSARKRAGVLYLHPIAAYHLRPGYSSAIYHPHRIEASSVTSVDGPKLISEPTAVISASRGKTGVGQRSFFHGSVRFAYCMPPAIRDKVAHQLAAGRVAPHRLFSSHSVRNNPRPTAAGRGFV